MGAGRAPVLAAGGRPRSRARAGARAAPSKSGTTTARWPRGGHGRLLLVHQVDLGAAALEPGEAVGQGGRRLDPLEAEQGRRTRRRARRRRARSRCRRAGASELAATRLGRRATTIAVDQVTASAMISIVEAVGVGDDHRVEAGRHRRHQPVGGGQVDQRRRQQHQQRRARSPGGSPSASTTGRVSGGGIGSSPCSAFSARVAPTAKKPIGRIATISACERSTRTVGRQRARRQQAGDRRVERRVAGEEGARPAGAGFRPPWSRRRRRPRRRRAAGRGR